MIQQPRKQRQSPWEQMLREMITDPLELLSLLKLSPEQIGWQDYKDFPLRVTKSFVERMKKGDPHDPLLRQVLPLNQESHLSPQYSLDPLQEKAFNPVPGLLHKYPSRVLLTLTSSCAVHCRYCFRRYFPYTENNPGRQWQKILNYLNQHPKIIEVILSGGDPLMASNQTIGLFLKELTAISHIQLVRIHTRLPIMIPQRINSELVSILGQSRFRVTMVYHINHPAEIVSAIGKGVCLLRQQGITVLNQSVLLQGINDEIKILKQLSLALFEAGILPYYVHMLDLVQGIQHFSVPLQHAKKLQQALREQLPGYLVPKFVQEQAYAACKTSIDNL